MSTPLPPQFNDSPGHVQSNLEAYNYNAPRKDPEMVFRTSKNWNIIFGIFSILIVAGSFYVTYFSLHLHWALAGLITTIQLVFFGMTMYITNQRTLILEKHFIRYSIGRKEMILPYKNIRSYNVTDGTLWGGVHINGGDYLSRVNFWALGNHETAIELVKKQADYYMLSE